MLELKHGLCCVCVNVCVCVCAWHLPPKVVLHGIFKDGVEVHRVQQQFRSGRAAGIAPRRATAAAVAAEPGGGLSEQ